MEAVFAAFTLSSFSNTRKMSGKFFVLKLMDKRYYSKFSKLLGIRPHFFRVIEVSPGLRQMLRLRKRINRFLDAVIHLPSL